jgi:membrane protein implicated in regulation of membrane protease activity
VGAHGGQVKLANGDIWTARTEAGDLQPGMRVRVSRIDGATAIVRSDSPDPLAPAPEDPLA